MSSFRKEDSKWIHTMTWQGYYGAMDETIMLTVFDQESDEDITEIQTKMDKEKFLKKVCLVKLVVFPAEFLSILFILGMSKASDHTKLTTVYYKYLRKHYTLEQFRSKLQEFYKERPIA